MKHKLIALLFPLLACVMYAQETEITGYIIAHDIVAADTANGIKGDLPATYNSVMAKNAAIGFRRWAPDTSATHVIGKTRPRAVYVRAWCDTTINDTLRIQERRVWGVGAYLDSAWFTVAVVALQESADPDSLLMITQMQKGINKHPDGEFALLPTAGIERIRIIRENATSFQDETVKHRIYYKITILH